MIIQNKPNQHYVWQHYLEPWTTNGKIYCLREHKNIINPHTRNIASQRYFYQIDGLTSEDCKWIRGIFIDRQNEFMKRLLDGWIRPVETLIKLRTIISAVTTLDADTEREVELIFKNQLEELHSDIESDGIVGLEKLKNGDKRFFLESSEDDDSDIGFILYLCFQYFRTKNIKMTVANNFDDRIFSDFNKAFNLVVPILATRLGYSLINLIEQGKFHCCLIRNNSEMSFITGDQPVVNMLAPNDPKIEAEELELYYPLSTNLALLISERQSFDFDASINDVRKYNEMINKQSLEMIFANQDIILRQYAV